MDWLAKLRPWLAPLSFVGGFGVDLLTLRRVDDVGDNLQLTAYLLAAAGVLVVERRIWHGRSIRLRDRHDQIRYLLQFLFGGLFSAYFVFYSRSATLGPSVAFCALLAGLMAVNEARFARIRPDTPVFALFFFCALSYLLFAVPTWTGWLGWGSRLLAAALAVGMSAALVVVVHLGPVRASEPLGGPPKPLDRALAVHGAVWTGLLVALLGGARLGLVPPVPLALAEAGVFHAVEVAPDGLIARYDAPSPWTPWRRDDRLFRFRSGDRVVCYTAVFAPRGASLAVVHAWDHWRDGGWVEMDRIPWTMRGGRDEGWRSWTAKRNVAPGAWRVRVLSEHGEELGRVRFEVVSDPGPAPDSRIRTLR